MNGIKSGFNFFKPNNKASTLYMAKKESNVTNQVSTPQSTSQTSKGSIYNGSETAGTIAYNYFSSNINFSSPAINCQASTPTVTTSTSNNSSVAA